MKPRIVSQAGVRAGGDENNTHDLAKLTVADPKNELAKRGLRKTGNKPELRARLEEYLNKEVEREVMIDGAAAPSEIE